MKMSHRNNVHTFLFSAMLLTLAAPLAAQDAKAPPEYDAAAVAAIQTVSPEAQAVLDNMTAYLKTLKSYSIQSTSTRDEVVAFGYKLQHNESSTLIIDVPKQMLRSDVTGDIRDRSFIYDGKTLVMYSPDDDVFTRAPAPDTIGKLIGGLLNAGIEMPMIDLLFQSFNGTIAEDVRGGIVVGESSIDGAVCDHLAFRQADADWQIWVEQGARPLLRKLVITTRYEVGDPQFQTTLRWDMNPKIDATTFSFTAPKGVTEIPFVDPASINVVTP